MGRPRPGRRFSEGAGYPALVIIEATVVNSKKMEDLLELEPEMLQ